MGFPCAIVSRHRGLPLCAAALLLLATGFASTLEAAAPDAKRPNVIVVMTDDQGLGDFSFTGNPHLKTPNFDRFARESVRLTDFHCAPMCSPTRGQLLTGLSALRNGCTSVTAGRTFLRPGLPTMAEAFSKAGWKTGLFGKWHLGDMAPHRPMDKGFQECVYHLGWGMLQSTPEFDWPLFDGRCFRNGVEERFAGHCTDLWFDRATAWMKERRANDEPFFLYLPTNAPHAPHIDIEKYAEPYRKDGLPAEFYGMIAHLDERFGKLDAFLAESGLKENTVLVFTTDNGGTAGVRVFNAGLRAGKTTYYEGGHRVPCWVRWPNGGLGEPRDVDLPTQNVDLFPTLAALCGVPVPPPAVPGDERFRGVDLSPLLKGEAKSLPERTFVVQYGQTPKKFESCVVSGRWRLVKGEELYDVVADRAQERNLAAERPEQLAKLRAYYETWWNAVEPQTHDFVPISFGAPSQPVVEMTSGDWEGIYADNTGFVREAVGGPDGGRWNVLVEAPGRYEFVLRRWPERTKAALGAAYEPSATSPSGKPKIKTVAFPTIAVAKVSIAGVQAETAADPKSTSATLSVALPAGRTVFKAWFADAEGKDLCGAFFVTVRKLE